MKRWKLLAITFLCAAVSMGGWWSSYPGPSPHSIPDIDLQAQYSGVGQCPNGFWVNGLNHDAPPTCSQVDFEQIIGEIASNQIPAGIVLQQPILNSPTLDGTTTFGPGSIINYDPTSVITFPDGSTWTAAGIANSTAQGLVITGPVGVVGTINVAGNVDVSGVVSVPSINANNITLSGPGGNWTFGYNGTSTAQINWPPNGSVFITQVSPGAYYISAAGSNPFSIVLGPPQRVEIGTNWVLRVVGGIAEPPSALPGSFYYNQTGNYMEYWNGTTWVSLAGLTGGACAAGDFVNSISSAGVITCGTPSGGGGSLPTPVSIGNGGLGQGVAPNPGQILVASGPTAYNPVTMTGDVTISPTGITTVTSPVIVSGSAPPSPRDAQLWFNTADLQTYIWYNDGTSSQWVPVVNLISGGFLPINNPTFTGTMTGPSFSAGATGIGTAGNLSVGAGTSTIALNGNVATDSTLGSGNALVVNVRGLPMLSVNAATGVVQLGTITGPSSSAVAFQIDASGNVLLNRNATLPLGATTLQQVQALIAAGGTWLPVNNPNYTGIMLATAVASGIGPGTTQPELVLPMSTGGTAASQIWFGGTATGNVASGNPAGAIGSVVSGLPSNSLLLSAGAYLDGSSFVPSGATGTNSEMILLGQATGAPPAMPAIVFYLNGNMAPPASFAPIQVASLSTSLNNAAPWAALYNLSLTAPNVTTGGNVGYLLSATANVNASAQVAINNATNGANSVSILRMITDASNGWIMNTSTGFTGSGPNVPGNVLQIGNTGAGGMVIATNASIGPPAPQIKIWAGPSEVGTFASDSFIVGLALPGFGSVYGGGNAGATGLSIGNGYISGTAFASIALSGAAHTNTANTAWIADGGCGSGCGLFQMSAEIGLTYFTGPIANGAPIPWVASWGWDQYTLAVQHMGNLQNSPAPTVINGSLMSGSRDTAGYILASAWPVQLNFGRPWANAPVCVASGAAGASGVYYTDNQNANNIQFGCVNYAGGPVCISQWFTYICMDVNAGM